MIRFLGSTKLAIALCLLLSAGGIAGSLLYQGNTAFWKPSTFNVFRSPLFLVPAGLLLANILFCVVPRLREIPAGKPRTWTRTAAELSIMRQTDISRSRNSRRSSPTHCVSAQ